MRLLCPSMIESEVQESPEPSHSGRACAVAARGVTVLSWIGADLGSGIPLPEPLPAC